MLSTLESLVDRAYKIGAAMHGIDNSLAKWLADDGRESSVYIQVRTSAPMETALVAVNTALARISAASASPPWQEEFAIQADPAPGGPVFLVAKEIEADRLVRTLADDLATSGLADARLGGYAMAMTTPEYPEVTRKPIGYEHELVEARLAIRASENADLWLVPPETQSAVTAIAVDWCAGLPGREPHLYVQSEFFAQALDVTSARAVVAIDVAREASNRLYAPIRIVAQQPGGLFRAVVLELNSSYASFVAGDCSSTPESSARWQQHMDSIRAALHDLAPHVHRGTVRRSLSWIYAGTMTVRTFAKDDPWRELQSVPHQQRAAEQVGFVDAGPGLVMPAAELPRVRTPDDLWEINVHGDTAVLTHRHYLAWLAETPPGRAIRDAARASISDLIVEAPPWRPIRLI